MVPTARSTFWLASTIVSNWFPSAGAASGATELKSAVGEDGNQTAASVPASEVQPSAFTAAVVPAASGGDSNPSEKINADLHGEAKVQRIRAARTLIQVRHRMNSPKMSVGLTVTAATECRLCEIASTSAKRRWRPLPLLRPARGRVTPIERSAAWGTKAAPPPIVLYEETSPAVGPMPFVPSVSRM